MAQLGVSSYDKSIGRRIQMRRKESNLSAEELSEKVGISQQQLSRYERGENKINITHLIHIAQMLDTPLSWFLLDCTPSNEIIDDGLKSRLDFHWQHLNNRQKKAVISLLDELLTIQK